MESIKVSSGLSIRLARRIGRSIQSYFPADPSPDPDITCDPAFDTEQRVSKSRWSTKSSPTPTLPLPLTLGPSAQVKMGHLQAYMHFEGDSKDLFKARPHLASSGPVMACNEWIGGD